MKISKHELEAILRSDFTAFVERSFYELNPDTTYLHHWYIEVIAEALEQCRLGKQMRLIINVPPRFLKSHMVSIAFVAWILGHNPAAQIICASYAQDLADKLASDCRALMTSSWYEHLFPSTHFATTRQAVHDLMTTQKGFRLATSVGGVLTGRGADFIIIDDPLKPDQALSETQRKAVNDWYDHTVISRLNDKRVGCIIVIMQRLHEDDLVGHLMLQGGWRLLKFPAIAEENETYTIQTPYRMKTFSRQRGEALHPERESLQILAQMRTIQGEYNFAGQYQQAPSPLGGGMIKSQWFKHYSPTELPDKFDFVLQSWDTANKCSELSDYTVCTTWGVVEHRLYLLDVFRKRMDYPDLRRAVKYQAQRYNGKTILIEDKASGTQLIQDLRADGVHSVTCYEPQMDKVMRMHSVTSTIENGFVYLPTHADWLPEYLHELAVFPNGRHDDQADSTSQALDWVKVGSDSQTLGVIEYYQHEALNHGLGTPTDAGTKLTPSETCPKCECVAFTKIGPQKRCAQCGHQWPELRRVLHGPSRRFN